MKKQIESQEMNKQVQDALQMIKDVNLPDTASQRRMQAQFIEQIHQVQPQNVSFPQNARLNHQKQQNKNLIYRWRTNSMTIKIIAIIMALTTLFSGAGAGTVFAAQSALPDQALYPVKLWSETVQLDLTQDVQEDLDLHLKFADRRVDEMLALLEMGKSPDNALQIELQTHLWMAAQLADQIEDPLQAQNQVRNTLMNQEMKLTNAPEDALMTQTRSMLHQQIQLMDCDTEECQQQVCEEGGCMDSDQLMTQDQIRDQLRTDQPDGAGNENANGYSGDYPEPQQGKDDESGNGQQQNNANPEPGNGGNNGGQQQKTAEPAGGQQNGGGK
jgi:hypothetical protein